MTYPCLTEMYLGFQCSCYSGFGWVSGTHRYAILVQGGIQLYSAGHLLGLVRISQNYSLVPALSDTPLVAVPSAPPRAERSLCRGCAETTAAFPISALRGWCCKQSFRRHAALGLCGLGKVFALLRCLGFIPPPGPVCG